MNVRAWKSLRYPTPVILEQPEANEVWLTVPLPQSNTDGVQNVGDNVDDYVGDNVGDGPENVTYKPENVGTTISDNSNTSINKGTEKGTEDLYAPIPSELLGALSDVQLQIIRAINETPDISLSDLARSLHKTVKAIRVQRKKLEESGIIMEHVGAQKNGVWKIRINRM